MIVWYMYDFESKVIKKKKTLGKQKTDPNLQLTIALDQDVKELYTLV